MSIRFRAFTLFSPVVLLIEHAAAFSGAPQDSLLQLIELLYSNGSYLSCELEARQMLDRPSLPDSVKVQGEKFVAFSLVAQGKASSAAEHFLKALQIDSGFTLDPPLTSPKIMEVFRDAKEEFRFRQHRVNHLAEDRDTGARPVSFRALVFPGWEQLHRGSDLKGKTLMGFGALSLVTTAVFGIRRRSARDEYLSAATPSEAVS